MALSGKMVGRITKTTASQTHTANAIRAHNNGGFSTRSFGDRRSTASINDRTIARYSNSMIAQGGNKRERALTAQEQEEARRKREERRNYAKASDGMHESKQEMNARAERGGFGDRMTNNRGNRFEAGRISRGSFGQTNNINGSGAVRPRMSGAANATARPAPKPTFRRPM